MIYFVYDISNYGWIVVENDNVIMGPQPTYMDILDEYLDYVEGKENV